MKRQSGIVIGRIALLTTGCATITQITGGLDEGIVFDSGLQARPSLFEL